MNSVRIVRVTRRVLASGVLLLTLLPTFAGAEECPRRFDQHTTDLPSACVFVGRYNATCGGEAMALFAGDGAALVVSLSAAPGGEPLFIPARVLSATDGKLVPWNDDLEHGTTPAAGTVRLEADGRRLRLRIADGELLAGGCPFEEFVGHFAGMLHAGEAGAPRAAVAY